MTQQTEDYKCSRVLLCSENIPAQAFDTAPFLALSCSRQTGRHWFNRLTAAGCNVQISDSDAVAHHSGTVAYALLTTTAMDYVRPNHMQLLRADDSPACRTRSLTYSGGSKPSISARSNLHGDHGNMRKGSTYTTVLGSRCAEAVQCTDLRWRATERSAQAFWEQACNNICDRGRAGA